MIPTSLGLAEANKKQSEAPSFPAVQPPPEVTVTVRPRTATQPVDLARWQRASLSSVDLVSIALQPPAITAMHPWRVSSRLWRVLTLALLLAGPVRTPAESPPRLPVEAFFAESDMRSVQVSPDGKYLTFLSTLGRGRVGVALMHLDTGKVEPLVDAGDENIAFYFWKGNDCIVYGGDLGGNESAALRSISIRKRKVVALAESYRERYANRANFATILDRLKFDPDRILISGVNEIGGRNYSLWLLDVRTGERWPVGSYEPKEDTGRFAIDNHGVIRGRSRYHGDKVIFEVRPDAGSPFTPVAEFPVDTPGWRFLNFAADNETLYLLNTEHTDCGVLQALNVRTRQLGPVLFQPPDGEIEDLLQSSDHAKLYGVVYATDKMHYAFFDPGRAELQKTIDASLPGTQNSVVSSSADEKILVVAATSDRDPGSYYLLNRQRPALMLIGRLNHRINPADMRPMEPVSFRSRDGLTLHGYLTRPANPAGKPGPLIVHPHGGPFGVRDSWGFDREVQFLANRGYAVLQINFRGSGGYGAAFLKAGRHEWGGRMQDDLTDGVKWAIAQGIADPKRIAIFGASYGGYAALAGAVFTPELYRCAVNYVGVSDLSLVTSWSDRFSRDSDLFYKTWVGDDKESLRIRSPVNFASRIRIPTLHAYGFNDPRVDIKHWLRLEPKLKECGQPYEIIIEDNEGHGFHHEKTRLNFYRKLDAFLAKYL